MNSNLSRTYRLSRYAPWLTLLACALVLGLRRPDAIANPQFWGEDSVIFFQDAYTFGGLEALARPYASYLHAIPRLSAAAAMLVDPRWAPALFVAIALGLTLYVAARTQSARCPLPRHAGPALAVVLVPDAFEVLLNVDNLQWFLAGGLALLLVSSDPHKWWQYLHDHLMAVVIGLTGPFSIVFAPAFIWRASIRRTRASTFLAASVLVAAGIQAWTVMHNPPGSRNEAIAIEGLLAAPGMRIAGSLLAGFLVPPDLPVTFEIFLGILVVVAVVALALRKGESRHERIWLAAVFFGLLATSLFRCRYVLPDLCHAGFGSRYFVPLQIFVIWLVFSAADDRRPWIRWSARIVLGWALAINVPRLRENSFPDLHWSDFAARIRAGEAVEVPVNPEPWVMKLPSRK